jgi:hypothetical protein
MKEPRILRPCWAEIKAWRVEAVRREADKKRFKEIPRL